MSSSSFSSYGARPFYEDGSSNVAQITQTRRLADQPTQRSNDHLPTLVLRWGRSFARINSSPDCTLLDSVGRSKRMCPAHTLRASDPLTRLLHLVRSTSKTVFRGQTTEAKH